MSETNPYQTPEAAFNQEGIDLEKVKKIATGQKLIIYAIFIHMLLITINIVLVRYGIIESTIYIVIVAGRFFALLLSIIGVIKLTSALGNSIIMKIIFIILLFLPLINLIVLLLLNSRATRKVQEAGYKVGLFGASYEK